MLGNGPTISFKIDLNCIKAFIESLSSIVTILVSITLAGEHFSKVLAQ